MSEREQAQQDFLREAKATLGLTWDDLAVKAGIVPRTFQNYRLPDDSANHRTMPRLAREAIQRLLDDHAKKNRKKAA
jgi:hypothetical protein